MAFPKDKEKTARKKMITEDMAEAGREGWLIEVTGGPNLECDTCKDYTYDDLVDDYWPASVAAALSYSERDGALKRNPSLDKADYVGFSNGCRAALDALSEHGNGYSNNWKIENTNGTLNTDTSLPASLIDTFVGVGCLGAFEGSSEFSTCMKKYGDQLFTHFQNKNDEHITSGELRKELLTLAPPLSLCWRMVRFLKEGEGPVSKNLLAQYLTWIKLSTDQQPANGLSLNKLMILEGSERGKFTNNSDDDVVTTNDAQSIYDNINANQKFYFSNFYQHNLIPSSKRNKELIEKMLNNKTFTRSEVETYVKQKNY